MAKKDAITQLKEHMDRMSDPMGLDKLRKAVQPDFGLPKGLADQIRMEKSLRESLVPKSFADDLRMQRNILGGATFDAVADSKLLRGVNALKNFGLAEAALRNMNTLKGIGGAFDSLTSLDKSMRALAAHDDLFRSMKAFTNVRDQLSKFDSTLAGRWNTLAPKALGATIFNRRQLADFVVLDKDDFLASLSWAEAGEDDKPVAKVISIHRKKSEGRGQAPRLEIHPATTVYCSMCHRQFTIEINAWLTGPTEVMLDIPIVPFGAHCANCASNIEDDHGDDGDLGPTYIMVRGEEESAPQSGRYIIVDSDDLEPPED